MENITMLSLLLDVFVPIAIAFIASSGFWIFLEKKVRSPRLYQTELLMGLAHDRIMYLGGKYIKRGYISQDEYENLHKYLYLPYKQLGGNGTIERIMDAIDELPIKSAVILMKGE